MISFLVHWLVQALALFVTVRLVSGVSVSSYGVLAVAALVVGLVNALVRPVLTLLSLPLTVLTLGCSTWWSTVRASRWLRQSSPGSTSPAVARPFSVRW